MGVVAGRARRRVPRASVLVEAVVDMLEREQQTVGQLLSRAVVGQVPGRSQDMVRGMAEHEAWHERSVAGVGVGCR